MKNVKFIVMLAVMLFGSMLRVNAVEGGKKVLYVDSYKANLWSSTIEDGIRSVLGKQRDINLRVHRMDTKNLESEDQKVRAGLLAKEIVEEWQPDVVITSDDNAVKYLVAPYYISSDIPFVCCGINYDAAEYGLSSNNITVMLETFLFEEGLELISSYANVSRLGFIGTDNLSSHKVYKYLINKGDIEFAAVSFCKNMAELMSSFLYMQHNVDLLFLCDVYSVENYNYEEMAVFARKNTLIPAFGDILQTITYSLFGILKSGEEQGEWAAKTAFAILNGKKPGDIPFTSNTRGILYLNLGIARKLDIKFPAELIVNSYIID